MFYEVLKSITVFFSHVCLYSNNKQTKKKVMKKNPIKWMLIIVIVLVIASIGLTIYMNKKDDEASEAGNKLLPTPEPLIETPIAG